MAVGRTLLDELRAQSSVDCDTLDYEVAKALGPFVDCTSNQAIAYGELQKPKNAIIVTESIELAKSLHEQYAAEVSLEQLAVEVMMVKLSSRMVKYITGYAHIQTNPYYAYSEKKTFANAKRILALYETILPTHPASRICIKIPSTHEGLRSCLALESHSPPIPTLATTLFSAEQAVLAAACKCTYVAPYINELSVHFVPGYVDPDRGFAVARAAQAYFEKEEGEGKEKKKKKTKVLAASLTCVEEVMQCAGLSHVTVSPGLLAELAATPASAASAAVVNGATRAAEKEGVDEIGGKGYEDLVADEAAYRIAFTRSKGGANEKKLTDAINIFADMQDRMEDIVRAELAKQ